MRLHIALLQKYDGAYHRNNDDYIYAKQDNSCDNSPDLYQGDVLFESRVENWLFRCIPYLFQGNATIASLQILFN